MLKMYLQFAYAKNTRDLAFSFIFFLLWARKWSKLRLELNQMNIIITAYQSISSSLTAIFSNIFNLRNSHHDRIIQFDNCELHFSDYCIESPVLSTKFGKIPRDALLLSAHSHSRTLHCAKSVFVSFWKCWANFHSSIFWRNHYVNCVVFYQVTLKSQVNMIFEEALKLLTNTNPLMWLNLKWVFHWGYFVWVDPYKFAW